jgi:hypothetical protein
MYQKAPEFRPPSRSGRRSIAALCDCARDTEGGRKDKPAGIWIDRNRPKAADRSGPVEQPSIRLCLSTYGRRRIAPSPLNPQQSARRCIWPLIRAEAEIRVLCPFQQRPLSQITESSHDLPCSCWRARQCPALRQHRPLHDHIHRDAGSQSCATRPDRNRTRWPYPAPRADAAPTRGRHYGGVTSTRIGGSPIVLRNPGRTSSSPGVRSPAEQLRHAPAHLGG